MNTLNQVCAYCRAPLHQCSDCPNATAKRAALARRYTEQVEVSIEFDVDVQRMALDAVDRDLPRTDLPVYEVTLPGKDMVLCHGLRSKGSWQKGMTVREALENTQHLVRPVNDATAEPFWVSALHCFDIAGYGER